MNHRLLAQLALSIVCLWLTACRLADDPAPAPFASSTVPVVIPAPTAETPENQIVPTPSPTDAPTPASTQLPSTLSPTAPVATRTSTPARTLATATPNPSPTAIEATTTSLGGPQIVTFSVSPQRIAQGDSVTVTWDTTGGEQVILCSIPSLRANGDCNEAPLSGTHTVQTDPAATIYRVVLTVSGNGAERMSEEIVCIDVSDFFFDGAQQPCGSAPPIASNAAAQRFERGLMIWIETVDEFLVFLDDHTYYHVVGPLQLKPGASVDNRLGGAPQGLYEPVSGFGLLWRGEVAGAETLRDSLGWAVQPEYAFDTVYQRGFETNWRLVDRYVRHPDGAVIHFFRQVYLGPRWDFVP